MSRNPAAKRAVFGVLALLWLLATTVSFAQSPDPKAEAVKLMPGAYYWTGTNWRALEPLEWSANGIKKNGKSSIWTYRHSEAQVQFKEATPLFCYRLPEEGPNSSNRSSLEGLVIARLDRKKDRRELEITSGGAAFAFRTGATKGRTGAITVTAVAPEVFLIAPSEPLSPGEYVIGDSALTLTGYDFGVRSAQ